MSEKLAIIEESILQDTADAIRSKNNTTSKIEPKDFKSNILNISGGEDVSAETTQYTSLLTDLETAIDALPDAGSGGGGGSVETCTVTIKYDSNISDVGFVPEGTFNILSTDGKIDYMILSETDATPENIVTGGMALTTWIHIVENVIKGSTIVLANRGMDYEYGLETSGSIEQLDCYFGMAIAVAFQINGDCQIKFTPV